MKICVITDENAGFTPEEAKELGIKVVKMPVIIDGDVCFEHDNLTTEDFYKALADDKDVSTSQPAPGVVTSLWDETLKEYDQIVHIPMSSGLSESTHTAQLLAEDYKDKVFVVDNHRISVTLKHSVFDALVQIKLGKTGQEIKDFLEQTQSESVIYIAVDTLKYLAKGGRISSTTAFIGNLLNIKPVLGIYGGKLEPYKKSHGLKKAKKDMLEALKRELETRFKDVPREELEFAAAYTFDIEEAKKWAKEIEEYFGIKTSIVCDPLSLSVATHIGPGALALGVSHIFRK